MNTDTPLPLGARPALGARRVLESLLSHKNAGLLGTPISYSEALATVWTHRALAAWVREAARLGLSPRAPEVFAQATDLPLLVSEDFVWTWEKDRPWASQNYDIPRHVMSEYRACLESDFPSSAYETNTPAKKAVWTEYLSKAPPEEFAKLLDQSANLWELWAESAVFLKSFEVSCNHTNNLYKNNQYATSIGALGHAAGLSPEQAFIFSKIETFWRNCSHLEKSMNFLISECGSSPHRLFSSLATGLGCKKDDLTKLFSSSSPLVREEFYVGLQVKNQDLVLPSENPVSLSSLLGAWQGKSWTTASAKLSEAAGNMAECFLKKTNQEKNSIEPNIAFDDWGFIGTEFHQIQMSIKVACPTILVAGPHGSGKTKIIGDLVNSSGKLGFTVPKTEKKLSNLDLRLACWSASLIENAVLVFDDGEHIFEDKDAKVFLENPKNPVLVSSSDPARLSTEARARFSRTLILSEMPLSARLKLASKSFSDPALALRVARSLRMPRAIIDAAAWCRITNSFDWQTVQSRHHASEKVASSTLYGSQDDFSLEPPDTLKNLPPMRGNATLVELGNRLARAFESPSEYEALGVKPPKGAIVVGPPGTGKTLFARHLAHRLQVSVIAPDPALFKKNPEKINALFEFARRQSPCIVLMDEAAALINPFSDAIPPLLTEIDGVEALEGVLVIMTTNSSFIHEALTRSGRLSEVREVFLPHKKEREDIWRAYLQNKPLSFSIEDTLSVLARQSRGMTGADIAETIRRAGSEAAAMGETSLSSSRLISACDDVRWAAPSGQDPVSEQERWKTAVHEAGHALLAWRGGLEVQRMTARARGGALGMVAWDVPERTYDCSRQRIHNITQMMLGGIAAEEALFGAYGSGGSADIEAVERVIKSAITKKGLGSLGPIAAGPGFLWSDTRRRQVELESENWARVAFLGAKNWLKAHKELVEKLARTLLEELDLSGDDLAPFFEEISLVTKTETWDEPPAIVLSAETNNPKASQSQHLEQKNDQPRVLHQSPSD